VNDNEYEMKIARENAVEWMKRAAEKFERAAEEMRRYAEDFEHACDAGQPKQAAKVVGWAVNGVVNVVPNLRLDMAPNIAIEVALAAEKVGQ
jgi:hypothetical protein